MAPKDQFLCMFYEIKLITICILCGIIKDPHCSVTHIIMQLHDNIAT